MSVPDREHGGQKTERLRVVDWEHPANNDFLLVSQFSVTGALYTCRPDLVGFVNGLPWVVIELKKPGVPARAAFDENLTHYKQQIPALFWSNALLIASNGTDSRVGSLTADWEPLGGVEAHRARGRAAPRVAGSDAARHLRPRPPARSGRELHAVFRAQGRAGQDHRPEPPVPRRQQRHRLDARSAQAGPRARRRVLADAGQRQELLDGVLRAEGAAQAGRQLDVRGRHRPRGAGRADRQDLQDHRRGERGRGRRNATPPAARTCANCCAATTATSSR